MAHCLNKTHIFCSSTCYGLWVSDDEKKSIIMYKKQFEDEAWTCYNLELIFISIWNVLTFRLKGVQKPSPS